MSAANPFSPDFLGAAAPSAGGVSSSNFASSTSDPFASLQQPQPQQHDLFAPSTNSFAQPSGLATSEPISTNSFGVAVAAQTQQRTSWSQPAAPVEKKKTDLSAAFVFPDSNNNNSNASQTALARQKQKQQQKQEQRQLFQQQQLSTTMTPPMGYNSNSGPPPLGMSNDNMMGGPMGGPMGGNGSTSAMGGAPMGSSSGMMMGGDAAAPMGVMGGSSTMSLQDPSSSSLSMPMGGSTMSIGGSSSSTMPMGGSMSSLQSPPPLQDNNNYSNPTPTTSQALSTTTTTSTTSNASEEGDDDEEDEEFLQAQRAALEAKAMMEKMSKEQEKRQQEGFLGLGKIIPKQPNFFHKEAATATSTTQQTQSKSNPWFQSASPTRDSSTPPWHSTQQNSQAAATSDFGMPPGIPQAATHDTVAATQNNNTAGATTGKGAAVMGASVVAGVGGLMVMGPILGVVAAGGAAYAAGTKEGPVGTILRGTGTLAAQAGGAAKRFDDKHQVVAKTAKGVASGVSWVVRTVNGGNNTSPNA